MRVLIAPDSFKETLSSQEAGTAIAQGLQEAAGHFSLRTLSVADGGEGTSQVLLEQGAVRHEASATNIYGEPLQAFWVQWKNFALVEASIGSRFVPPSQRKKDGMQTTSWGTGQLIAQALNHPAVQTVYVALGGSGSTDGGMGMMAALGARFYDARGRLLLSEGKMIAQVAQAVLPTLAKPVIGLYDVAVPLYGPRGCVQMFGRQKGVAESALDEADRDMMRYSEILHQGGHGDPSVPGAGSAGGMGFGILALGGQLQSGAEMVAQWTHLDHWIQWADCIVTGEGRIDDQTYEGKVVGTIVRHAQRQKRPVIALVGERQGALRHLYQAGLQLVYPLTPGPMTPDDAMRDTALLLQEAAKHIAPLLDFYAGCIRSKQDFSAQ